MCWVVLNNKFFEELHWIKQRQVSWILGSKEAEGVRNFKKSLDCWWIERKKERKNNMDILERNGWNPDRSNMSCMRRKSERKALNTD